MCECLRGALAPSDPPDVPDERLGGQFSFSPSLSHTAFVRVCELEISVYEVKMKGASK